jgi:hypothetical protein
LVVVCEESIFFSLWTRLSLRKHITKCNTIILDRIPQMNKYFVMRECEHIGDTSVSSQEVISIFKFPERFLEISCRDLISFTFQQL